LNALTGNAQLLDESNISHLFLLDMAQSFMEKNKELTAGETDWSLLAAVGHITVDLPVSQDGGEIKNRGN
jgi:hypothetical protein